MPIRGETNLDREPEGGEKEAGRRGGRVLTKKGRGGRRGDEIL